MYSELEDIVSSKNWNRVEKIANSRAKEKQYIVWDSLGYKYILRLSDIANFNIKMEEFQKIKDLYKRNKNTPKAISLGICNNGNNVYQLYRMVGGMFIEEELAHLV